MKATQTLRQAADKRRMRRNHRVMAAHLINSGTLLNAKAPRGSIPHAVAMWHLDRARHYKR